MASGKGRLSSSSRAARTCHAILTVGGLGFGARSSLPTPCGSADPDHSLTATCGTRASLSPVAAAAALTTPSASPKGLPASYGFLFEPLGGCGPPVSSSAGASLLAAPSLAAAAASRSALAAFAASAASFARAFAAAA